MKTTKMLALLLPLATLFGCADEKTNPKAPAVGSIVIDRMARPTVNTAVTDPFFSDSAAHGRVLDAYNNASNPAQWVSLYTTSMAANIAIYDGLDRVCGNQLLAGAQAAAGRYNTLASVLADDRLWVNTASATCTTYLAVEANATGVIPNQDCGGRGVLYDVIDVSYSVLAVGALGGVSDGVGADPEATSAVGAFPFMAVAR